MFSMHILCFILYRYYCTTASSMNIKVQPKNGIYSIKLLYLGYVPREDAAGDGQETRNLQSMALNRIAQCMVGRCKCLRKLQFIHL